jgi:hypothetical protein
MNLFEEDVENFLTLLVKRNVKFILIGGLAVNFHGHSRATGDVDIWIKDTLENRKNLILALGDYKIIGAEAFESIPLIAGFSEILLDSGIYLDMMTEMQFFKQDKFDECYELANPYQLSDFINIAVIHINHLIYEKEKSKRPKDILDAEVLKKIISIKQ